MRRSTAFTLIELLIVVAIIAILAAIAIPNFLHAQTRAKIARSLADMKSLAAIESFRADTGLDLMDNWDDGMRAQYLALGYQSPATTDLPGYNATGSVNLVFSVLTTPVDSIASIPRDPFLLYDNSSDCLAAHYDSGVCLIVNLLKGTCWYGDFDGHNGTNPNSPDQHFYALLPSVAPSYGIPPLRLGEWALLGVGPNNRPENVADIARRGIPYDLTNGLVSRGDLTVRSSGMTQ